jgi:hypothetical protein
VKSDVGMFIFKERRRMVISPLTIIKMMQRCGLENLIYRKI